MCRHVTEPAGLEANVTVEFLYEVIYSCRYKVDFFRVYSMEIVFEQYCYFKSSDSHIIYCYHFSISNLS